MKKYYISINQFAEFSSGTKSSKLRIVKQQQVPNKLLIPWYQKAKGAIKRFLFDVNDYTPIETAILQLDAKTPTNNRQKIDKQVSIEALELLKKIKLPKILKNVDYEVVSSEERDLIINNVDIRVAPEVIFRVRQKNDIIYGAIKVHVSKGKPFNLNQASFVATLIYQFLSKKVAGRGEFISPNLCFCLDVFAERFVSAPENISKVILDVKGLCKEIKNLWSES